MVPRDELLAERSRLQRQLMDEIDVEYIRIETLLDQVNARIRMVTEPDEVQKVYEALLLDYGQALALASNAEEIASRLERTQLLYKDTLRCFTEERQRILAACDFFATRAVGDENLQKVLSRLRGEMTEFHIADYQLQGNVTQASSLKRDAAWLRQIAEEPPKPPLATTISPALRAECELLQQLSSAWKEPEATMTAAVEEARAKFVELRDLLPLEPPAFSLSADQLKPQVWKFTVESIRIPENAKLIYAWDFGDGATADGLEARRQHVYSKPGVYTVHVRAFLERENLSEDLGEVTTQISMGDPVPNPPGKPETVKTEPVAGQLMVGALLRIEGSHDTQGEMHFLIDKDPVGKLISRGWLSLSKSENSEKLTGSYRAELGLRLPDEFRSRTILEAVITPSWTLTVDGTASGTQDLRTGTAHLRADQATWEESSAGEAAGKAEAHRLLGGVSPEGLGWTGEITGTMDWKNFGGGEGRFQINKLLKGTWKTEPLSAYGVVPPAEAALYGRLPQLRIFRNEALAIKQFTPYLTRLSGGMRKPVGGYGDQAFWSLRGMLVRTGRWHIDYTYNYGSRNPETFRDSITRIQKFIEDSQLDSTLPILPDP